MKLSPQFLFEDGLSKKQAKNWVMRAVVTVTADAEWFAIGDGGGCADENVLDAM